MAKITVADLSKIKARVKKETSLTKDGYTVEVTAHLGTCGLASGGDKVYAALQEEIEKAGRKDIRIVISGCAGMCSSEPNVTIRRIGEDAVIYKDLNADKMREIFEGHILNGEIPKKYAMARIK